MIRALFVGFFFSVGFPLALFAAPFEITLNDREKSDIREIIRSMGEKNIAFLFLESGHLTELGNRVDHVHPLQFIGFIVTDPELRRHLEVIHKNYFKWTALIEGFSGSMERELVRQALYPELEKFAVFIRRDYQILLRFVYTENWKGFVESLM